MRKDGKGDIGTDQTRTHLIDGAITTCHSNDVILLCHSFLSQSNRMASIICDHNVIIKTAVVKILLNGFRQILLVSLARNRIEDE